MFFGDGATAQGETAAGVCELIFAKRSHRYHVLVWRAGRRSDDELLPACRQIYAMCGGWEMGVRHGAGVTFLNQFLQKMKYAA